MDAAPGDPLSAALSYRRPRLQHILEGLRRARTDPGVAAVLVKVGGGRLTLAAAQEVRDALAEMRRAGNGTNTRQPPILWWSAATPTRTGR